MTRAGRTGSRLRRHRGRRLAIAWAAIATALALAVPAAASMFNEWDPTRPMSTGRYYHVAALLRDGRVLVAGGRSATVVLKSTEIYDRASDAWSAGPEMGTPRQGAAAVTLQSAKVLVVGGSSTLGAAGALDTGEVFDPSTHTWTSVANHMSSARGDQPVAVLLPSGKVLITSGSDAGNMPVGTADLYDPGTNSFEHAKEMTTARARPEAALLPSGKVLVAGGRYGAGLTIGTGEVYDPVHNDWTLVSNHMTEPTAGGEAASLPGDKVLLAGGSSVTNIVGTTEIYNSATNTFSAGPPMMSPRAGFALTPLHDRRVLSAGGVSGPSEATPLSEIYDPATNSWSAAGPLPVSAGYLTSTLLPDGHVLATGGTTGVRPVSNAELFTPTTKPGAPRSVSAAARSRSALVTFAAPLLDGGERIQHYTVRASTGQTATVTGDHTFVTIQGLRNGRPVKFTVTAVNSRGAGPASVASSAIIPGPPILRITGLKKTLKLSSFLKGVEFSVTPNKAASLQISLLGTVKRATIAAVFNLTLASKHLELSANKRTVRLVPSKKLTGNPRRVKVELLIVATDADGNRSTTTKTISVSR